VRCAAASQRIGQLPVCSLGCEAFSIVTPKAAMIRPRPSPVFHQGGPAPMFATGRTAGPVPISSKKVQIHMLSMMD